jgi:thioredoxin-like negative regulator of GroEL
MDIETTLRQGVHAAKAGRKEEARQLLEAVLDADERNEQAWLWMSDVVDSDEERLICLENVLAINPNNEIARKGLAALGAVSVVDQSKPFDVSDVVGDAASTMTQAEPHLAQVPMDRVPTSDRRPFIIITIALVLLLICTVVSILAFVVLSPGG